MLFDTHIHTKFSTDSRMIVEQAITAGQKLDLGIIITEHMDLAYPKPEAFIFDKEAYFAECETYRGDKVRLGIELGMRNDCLELNRQLVSDGRFDYIIGSIHVIDNIDIYDGVFYQNRTKQEVYAQYFEAMTECLQKYDFIHSLGHIDYIARYAHYPDPEIYYHEYSGQIDNILSIVASRDQALEINTRRLKDKTAAQNLKTICRRFREVGGRLAVIGSDAHQPQNIGCGIKEAYAMALECGLAAVYFKEGRPFYIK